MKTRKKATVAMLLAGGQGSRLGLLTARNAKPAIPFGGKYRVIDFPLSNCAASGIDTVGVLTQFKPLTLHAYIGNGQPWDLDRMQGGVTILPPYQDGGNGGWYLGTADAIRRNLEYLDGYDPDRVLILSGDHVYCMDYEALIDFHVRSGADCTVASFRVDIEEAHRFGILTGDEMGRVKQFEEKPLHPTSTLASMGIYVFEYPILRKLLIQDEKNPDSSGDFGKDILPGMLKSGMKLYTWEFKGYFRDVGTPESYFAANMDLVRQDSPFDLHNMPHRICSRTAPLPPHRIGCHGRVKDSVVTEGCIIDGSVERAVLSARVRIHPGAVVRDAVLMEGVEVSEGAWLENCIVDEGALIGKHCVIGGPISEHAPITVIGQGLRLESGTVIPAGSRLSGEDEDAIINKEDLTSATQKGET